jgi:glucokinase
MRSSNWKLAMQDDESIISLAVDIGGSKVEIALINVSGKLIGDIERKPVPFTKGFANQEGLFDIIQPKVEKACKRYNSIKGMGLSICALVDEDTGRVSVAPNLHWYDVPLGEMATKRFGIPTFVATDSRMAALGESIWGEGQDVDSFVWVTLGTGLGAYLVINGKLYGGDHGFAGAFGHNTIDDINGSPCGCGRRGCLETFASGRAVARNAQAAIDTGHKTILREMAAGKPVTAEMVFQAAEEGDLVSKHIINQLVRYVAIGLSSLINTLDISLIILGGGVMRAGLDLLKRIEIVTRDHLVSPESRRDLRIVPESLPNAALFGVAANVFIRNGYMEPKW